MKPTTTTPTNPDQTRFVAAIVKIMRNGIENEITLDDLDEFVDELVGVIDHRWVLTWKGQVGAASLKSLLGPTLDTLRIHRRASPLELVGSMVDCFGLVLEERYELRRVGGPDICPGMHHACKDAYNVVHIEQLMNQVLAKLNVISTLLGECPFAGRVSGRVVRGVDLGKAEILEVEEAVRSVIYDLGLR